MTNPIPCVILIPETKNNNFTERNRIMRNFIFAYEYECEAVFCSEEYGCAKHAHTKISKMSGSDWCAEFTRIPSCLNYESRLSCVRQAAFCVPSGLVISERGGVWVEYSNDWSGTDRCQHCESPEGCRPVRSWPADGFRFQFAAGHLQVAERDSPSHCWQSDCSCCSGPAEIAN